MACKTARRKHTAKKKIAQGKKPKQNGKTSRAARGTATRETDPDHRDLPVLESTPVTTPEPPHELTSPEPAEEIQTEPELETEHETETEPEPERIRLVIRLPSLKARQAALAELKAQPESEVDEDTEDNLETDEMEDQEVEDSLRPDSLYDPSLAEIENEPPAEPDVMQNGVPNSISFDDTTLYQPSLTDNENAQTWSLYREYERRQRYTYRRARGDEGVSCPPPVPHSSALNDDLDRHLLASILMQPVESDVVRPASNAQPTDRIGDSAERDLAYPSNEMPHDVNFSQPPFSPASTSPYPERPSLPSQLSSPMASTAISPGVTTSASWSPSQLPSISQAPSPHYPTASPSHSLTESSMPDQHKCILEFLLSLKPPMDELVPRFLGCGISDEGCLDALGEMPAEELRDFLREDLGLNAFQVRIMSIALRKRVAPSSSAPSVSNEAEAKEEQDQSTSDDFLTVP
ncbi:hypothetical protein NM688_g7994 [Phlebia brevispora]|uniref:Uncharacterized protein n=1 Tax=Phlebia brevispora TaxID=194682 RepID=A0ACC1RYT5_9APHY|nr:hypothetical protein NM688_g7994 [Phlebia brevispora]